VQPPDVRYARTREREHRSVALRFNDRAAMYSRRSFDYCVLSSEEGKPCMVSELPDQDGGIDDVGEDDRDGAIRSEGA
jgi:hypothetical protein